jgi:hypothetical protein
MAFFYGFLVWLIPFLIGFLLFPIREADRGLFETVMALAIVGSASYLATRYFALVNTDWLSAGVKLGLLWFAISVIIDLPMFLNGPMKMTPYQYFSDIGLTYLVIPCITIAIGFCLKRQQKEY